MLLSQHCWCCHLALLVSLCVRFRTLPPNAYTTPSCLSFLNQSPWDMLPYHFFCVSFFPSCRFFVFFLCRRGLLFCFRFSTVPLSFGKTPLLTSNGRVVDLAPDEVVQFLDSSEYRVVRINATSQNVTLKKINAPKHRAFVRPASQIWVTPPLTSNMSVHVNEPTPHCLCSPPLPLPALPDTIERRGNPRLVRSFGLVGKQILQCSQITTRFPRGPNSLEEYLCSPWRNQGWNA